MIAANPVANFTNSTKNGSILLSVPRTRLLLGLFIGSYVGEVARRRRVRRVKPQHFIEEERGVREVNYRLIIHRGAARGLKVALVVLSPFCRLGRRTYGIS